MPNLNPWAVGRHATVINFIGQAVAADGTLTTGTAVGGINATQSVLTKWDEIDIDSDPESEEISSADATRQHTVILKEAFRVRVQTILRKARVVGEASTAAVNPLAFLFGNFDYFLAVVTSGGETFQGYVCRGRFSRQHRKGRQIDVGSFEPADPNTANPVYTPA